MKLKRVIALLMASALSITALAGCTDNKNTEAEENIVNYEQFTTDFSADDDAFYMDLLGGKASDTIMTADGLPVDTATYSYWLAYYLTYFADSVNSSDITSGTVEIEWEAPWDETRNISDVMKEYAGSSASYYAVIQKIADEYGIVLEDADREAVAQTRMESIHNVGETLWEEYVDGGYITESLYDEEAKEEWIMEKGAEVYLQQLAGIGSTDAGYNNISLLTALYEKTRDTVFGENGAKAPTTEDLDTYVEENNLVCVKFIYFPSYDESYNEVDNAGTAADMLADIQNSEDPSAAFEQYMEEENSADFSQYPNGYIASVSDFSTDLLNAVNGIEEGAIYDEVFSDDYGWYIMQHCAMDQEQLGIRYRDDAMNDLLNEYLDDIQIETTDLYDNLDVTAYYEKILAAQNGTTASEEDESSDEVKNEAESQETQEPDVSSESSSSEDETSTETTPAEEPETSDQDDKEIASNEDEVSTSSEEETMDETTAEDETSSGSDDGNMDGGFLIDKVQP